MWMLEHTERVVRKSDLRTKKQQSISYNIGSLDYVIEIVFDAAEDVFIFRRWVRQCDK